MKKLLLLFTMMLLLTTSCTTNSDDISSETKLIGKWAFGPETGCDERNSIEFKSSNIFIDHHYSPSCNLTLYHADYELSGNNIRISENYFIITELTESKLTLYSIANEEEESYDRIN